MERIRKTGLGRPKSRLQFSSKKGALRFNAVRLRGDPEKAQGWPKPESPPPDAIEWR